MAKSGVPVAPPPPGLTSDFNQNSDLWPSLIAVSVISLVIMTFAVSARLYAKGVKSRKIGREDYLSAFAVVIMIVWTVIYDISCHLGISKHQWNVRASDIPRIFNYLNICDILYGPMLGAAKFSLLLQLHRHSLKHKSQRTSRKWFIYATGTVIFGYYFSCIFQFAFQCVPRKGLWDPTAHAKCGSSPWLTFAAAGFGLLTDLMLYVLLLWLIAVAGLTRLGGWLGIASINVVALFGIATAAATLFYRVPFLDPSLDFSYHVAIVGIWAMAEYAAIILVGCIPSFGVWSSSAEIGSERKAGDLENQPAQGAV